MQCCGGGGLCMRSLASILDSMKGDGPEGGATVLERAVSHWSEAAGSGLAGLSRPVSFEDGALLVRVDHPAAAMELELRAGEITDALNKLLGGSRVRRILPSGRSRRRER